MLSSVAMQLRPALPGRSDTPMTAIDFGFRSRVTCAREIVRACLFALTVEHAQTGTVFLPIKEARQRAIADVFLVHHAQRHRAAAQPFVREIPIHPIDVIERDLAMIVGGWSLFE